MVVKKASAFIICLVFLSSASSICFSASKHKTKTSTWHIIKQTDKMTDKLECHLDSPSRNILMSFQAGNIYLVSGEPISTEDIGIIEMRVDKNASFSIPLRIVNLHVAAISDPKDVQIITDQFSAGASYFVRLSTLRGIEEDKATLNGFKNNYDEWKRCAN